MSEGPDRRDSENNWVIPGAESFPVETVGATHDGAEEVGEEEVGAAGSEPMTPPDSEETAPPPPDVKHVLELGEDPAHQEPPVTEEPEKPEPPPVTEGPKGPQGGDREEVSCSSSDDDVEGLRKRAGRGSPLVSVGPHVREAAQQNADEGSSLNLSTLIIAAVGLLCIGLLVFTGGNSSADDDPQTVMSRSVKGGDKQPPQVISDIQEWIEQHADQFTGDPSSLEVMSGLLDKVAKKNQEIRHMQAKFQAQKEELEALLYVSEGHNVTPRPQHPGLTEENVRLKDTLLKEETAHLSAKEELKNLQEKLEVLETSGVDKETLVAENNQLKVDLDAFRRQIEGFLAQKETLVAESQMLRQELDKQRLLVASMKQDLENLVTKSTEGEDEKLQQERLSDMSSKLAMEAQRSETWEKKYVEHAQRRKEQVGEERRNHGHKEWKSSKTSDPSTPGGDFRKTHHKHGKEHGKRWKEEGHRESQHEEWRSKKHEDKHWQDKKHRHWEGEKAEAEIQEEQENWKSKEREHSHDHPERQARHHQGEAGDGFHPRKGQKDFTNSHKRREDSERGKEHRHHDHNKFWKKLSDHQYRVPEGCSGLEDCARKDGMDLFNVELKPVQRKQFEEVLLNYLTKSQLSEHLPELTPLLDGFFEGPLFSHHKIRFKDFVDDVEDFLEDVARKETGDDDIVDDFERYVYTNFFGEAATKKRFAKKDEQQKTNKYHKHSGKLEKTYDQGLNQSDDQRPTDNKPFRTDLHVDSRDFKPIKKQKTHEKHKPWSLNLNFEEESDHKFEDEDKHSPNTHHRSIKQNDHNDNGGSFHHHGAHSENNPKYHHTKPYREADGRHHNGHHFNKKYKEHQEDRQRRHHNEHNYNPENHGHHNTYKEQKSPDERFGKDADEYKHKNPDKYKEEVEHKHYPKKHEKDCENKRYQSSQRDLSHHHDDWSADPKPWRGGDHGHRHPDSFHKNDQRPTQQYPSKTYYHKHEEDEGRHRDYHQKHDHHGNYYQKHGKDKHGNDHQTYEAKDRDGDYHHNHENDRDGDYHHKYDNDHHKPKDNQDGDYHRKFDKDHHIPKYNRDGDYHHKYDKDHHKTKDNRDEDYHHKYDKDHPIPKDMQDGDYHHKYDKDHHKPKDDGDYHQKYDKHHHKSKDDRDGDYHKYNNYHHKHEDDRDGDYQKYDKHHHKPKDDRDEDYHKYDKDHHKHEDDQDGENNHKPREGKDRHGNHGYKHGGERKP